MIYPELLIDEIFDDKNIIKVIDEKQEQIARSLDLGHHLIRGVAGSGKTVILIARAKFLAQAYPNWNILFLCYNKALCMFLRERLKQFRNIYVMTFHGWCMKELKSAGMIFDEENFSNKDFDTLFPQKLLELYSKNTPLKKYQAILIDEGQDFDLLWYKTIISALDEKTNCLLIALDSSQTIYKRKIVWKTLGIDIVGKSKVLKKNYRNTKQILDAAYDIIREMDMKKEYVCDEEADYIVPEQALREGPAPEFKKFNSADEETKFLVNWVKSKLKEEEEILVLCPTKKDLQELEKSLNNHKIKCEYIFDKKGEAKVILSTIHSSKGLEADKVFIFDAHKIEKLYLDEAKRLLYIGMTRSRQELCVCYIGDCKIVKSKN